ncbi:GHKL domain-containing protein [Clostridium collagenovorans DSM 3089]|uniref:GHKL domain-containing protein n=1 Tax=Clostridium collagenovorans DSM 3089 TaxID=1121306 RepID=A0A1M5XGJ8_9CLOT|nr:sensor histidine kinase [Clostridium collagenovorans]SHH98658.1 GHKL domain-containing protein [Clostridium collagenovorans DSM 3089]
MNNVYWGVEYITTFVESVLGILFMSYWLEKRWDNRKQLIISIELSFVCSIIIILCNRIKLFDASNIIVSMLMFILISIILYKGSLVKIILTIGANISIGIICDLIVVFLFSKMSYKLIEEVLSEVGTFRSIAILLGRMILITIILEIGIYKYRDKTGGKKYFLISLILSCFIIYVSLFFIKIISTYENDKNILYFSMLFYTVMLVIILFIYLGLLKFSKDEKELEEMKMIKNKNKMLEENLVANEKIFEEWKKLQHDFRHNLLCLNKLVEEKKYVELAEYLSELNNNVSQQGYNLKTGNKTLDIILNYYSKISNYENIHMNINVNIPEGFFLKDTELCSLLGNSLENAIEATRKSEEKMISVIIKSIKDMIIFKISNSYNEDLEYENGIFKTTKKEKELHGIGLKSIKNVVKKNNGTMNINLNNKMFNLIIQFSLKEIVKI